MNLDEQGDWTETEKEVLPPRTDKEERLRKRLKKSGYDLFGIIHFKNFDRVIFGNDHIKISINMRGKLSEIAFDTLVQACIGKKAS